MRRWGLCLVLAVLAGCGGVAPETSREAIPRPTGIGLETDENGLTIIAPRGGRIDFGRAPSGVIATLERELGPGRVLGLGGCPAPIRQQIAWGDLVLTFTAEQFVGWRAELGDLEAGRTCGGTLA